MVESPSRVVQVSVSLLQEICTCPPNSPPRLDKESGVVAQLPKAAPLNRMLERTGRAGRQCHVSDHNIKGELKNFITFAKINP